MRKILDSLLLLKFSIPLVILLTGVILVFNELVINKDSFFSVPTCENKIDKKLLNRLKTIAGKDLKVCLYPRPSFGVELSAYQIYNYNVIFTSQDALNHSHIESFLIHETGHLKYNHPNSRRWIFLFFSLTGISLSIYLLGKRKFKTFIVALFLGSILGTKVCQYIYIHQEYEADSLVAQEGNKQGLIQLFKRSTENKHWSLYFFRSHPSNFNRIRNLSEEERNYELF